MTDFFFGFPSGIAPYAFSGLLLLFAGGCYMVAASTWRAQDQRLEEYERQRRLPPLEGPDFMRFREHPPPPFDQERD